MSMLVWIILGLVSGFIASKIVNRKGEGFVVDILLGVVGAIAGGWLFGTFGKLAHLHRVPGVTGLNLESLLVAVVGAVAVLVVYHALRRSTAGHHRRRAR
ncbi:MAG TPA: GlsB/YeaQ/YmgE family stress response membrane protein [Thermoanaerobaculia bacterium]|nr:GlsB/YeaQ/YmgE family stress response membrane protein [Thermoanaerobaculia bacterium]